MFQNRLVNVMVIILVSFTLIGVVALVLFNYFETPEAGADPSIDKIIENSWQTEEITTNLNGDEIVRASFQIHTDTKSAKNELEKRDFQMNNLIIRHLAGLSAAELQSQKGIDEMESELRNKMNEMMDEGKIVRVYTTQRMIQ
ncbi:flagellar basal body-associated protein FliL [Alteribacillus sp. HJP-4]|uniref:flagellar basal body-associated protein FliL n=1 Tax=Alteribacillus sp. HJP-4 TaxID=2775394 RepID=UPI0035CCF8CF